MNADEAAQMFMPRKSAQRATKPVRGDGMGGGTKDDRGLLSLAPRRMADVGRMGGGDRVSRQHAPSISLSTQEMSRTKLPFDEPGISRDFGGGRGKKKWGGYPQSLKGIQKTRLPPQSPRGIQKTRIPPQLDSYPSIPLPLVPGQEAPPYPRSDSPGARRQAVEEDLRLPPVTPTGGSSFIEGTFSIHEMQRPPDLPRHRPLSPSPTGAGVPDRIKRRLQADQIAPQGSTKEPSERIKRMCVSYTISEDMSGDRRNKILSRIGEKKRSSCEVRLRVRGSSRDHWSLKQQRKVVGDDNGGRDHFDSRKATLGLADTNFSNLQGRNSSPDGRAIATREREIPPSLTGSYSSYSDDRGSQPQPPGPESRRRPQQHPHLFTPTSPIRRQVPYPRFDSPGARRRAVEEDLRLPPVTPTRDFSSAGNYSPDSSTSSHSNLPPPQQSGLLPLSPTPEPSGQISRVTLPSEGKAFVQNVPSNFSSPSNSSPRKASQPSSPLLVSFVAEQNRRGSRKTSSNSLRLLHKFGDSSAPGSFFGIPRVPAKRQKRPQFVSHPPEKDATMGYVRNLTKKVGADELRHVLNAFGQLIYFDVDRANARAPQMYILRAQLTMI